ncbi:unnamed protein product [Trichobilharzia regenti]|nr:unnamed protein product [Trichobilharzia regenti]
MTTTTTPTATATITTTQSDLNSLIAEAEENAQKLVLRNYIPTLIIITCFLVFISIFGLIGNWLVVHTIGRHIFRRFFHLLEHCLRVLCICCRRNKPLEYQQTQLHVYQCREDVNQSQITNCLDVNQYRSPSLVPLGHLSNSTEEKLHRQHEPGTNHNFTTTTTTMATTNGLPQTIQQTTDGSTEYLGGSRQNIHRSSSVKRPTTQTNLNSDLLIVLLAINDLIICAVDIPTTIFLIVWETRTYDFMCRAHVTLKAFTLTVSALFLVIIALDRWLLICFIPCIIMTKRCIIKLIIITYILGLLWAIPMGLHQGVHTYFKISTVDKLVPNDIEAYIMFQELSSPSSASSSLPTSSVSSMKPSSSSFAYISSKFIDLITSFTNYGYCKSDERFISSSGYEIYQMSILILFAFIFTCICLFYGYLFFFILVHQYRWRTKFAPRTILVKPIAHEIIHENSNNSPNNFNPTHRKKNLSKTAIDEKHTRERFPSVQIAEVSTTTPTSQQDPCNKRIRHSDPLIYTHVEIDSYKNIKQNTPSGNLQPHISITRPEDKKTVPEQNKKSKRFLLFKPMMKRPTRPRLLHHNRHMRSAITFILITVSFLISYLPSLLIANGFIWPVKWELSTDTTTDQASSYYNHHHQIKNTTSHNGTSQILTDESPTLINYDAFQLVNPTDSYHSIQSNEYINNNNNNSSITSNAEIKYHLRRLFHFLYFINSAANPLIYFFFNLKFRAALKRLLTSMSSCFTFNKN